MRRAGVAVVLAVWMTGLAYGRPPNIVIFYTDDMGKGDVGCYGADDIRTPNIDALASSGIRFTNYYAPSPICAPSRAALMTGRYPRRAGMSAYHNIGSTPFCPGLNPEETTLAELVKPLGYATAAFGKWHLGSVYPCQANSQGFDEFFGHLSSCIDSFSHMYYASEPYFHDLWHNREEVFEDGVHMTDLITRETTRFIKAHSDQPFLAYVAYNTPHYPMVAKKQFLEMYKDLPRLRRFHAALVAGIDDSVGTIMQTVREAGLEKDTFVFFASDNGAANRSLRGEGGGSNLPGREYKRSLFAGGIEVPGIVSWPGVIPGGQVRDQLTIAMDVFATVAEMTASPLPPYRVIDGQSWVGLLKDGNRPGHDALFFEWDEQRCIRWGKWKLLVDPLIDQYMARHNRPTVDGGRYIFLVDTETDPGETTNVVRQHPEVVERMLVMFDNWRRAIGQDPTASPLFESDERSLHGTDLPAKALGTAGVR